MHALWQPPYQWCFRFATSLKLTPSTLDAPTSILMCHEFISRVLQATSNKREWRMNTRWGTEAVNGEVAMDEQGDGCISIAKVISIIIFILYAG